MLYLARRRMPALFGGAAAVTPWYLSGGINAANCIIAYQPKGAASLAASYVNLVNPGTYDAAPGTAPTFAAATGWTFASASSQYLVTGYSTDLTTAHSLLIRFAGASGTLDQYLIGKIGGARIEIAPSGFFAGRYYNIMSKSLTAGSRVASGVIGFTTKANGVDMTAYYDGSSDGALTGAYGGATGQLIIGAENNSYGFIDASVQAYVIYNKELNATEVAAVSAAMAAL